MTVDLTPRLEHVLLADAPLPSPHARATHRVINMPPPLGDVDAYRTDTALTELVAREGASWADERIGAVGRLVGSRELGELAREANEHEPTLRTHDRVGHRLDRVEYHPSWHELMRLSYASGVHSFAWSETGTGRHVARGAMCYLWNQGENGIHCPTVMSYAVVPLLRAHPEVGTRWENGILANAYDPRHVPAAQKRALTMAMSMTEKQGGSDVRANETVAEPTGSAGEYLVSGHKFFCSAPMGDIVLLTARTAKGVSLFIAPRLLPDGRHNGIRIQRLKDKMGNRSNASAEIELDGTLAVRIGEDGRGIREFVRHMTHGIRLDLTVGSAGIMRKALTLAFHHTRGREAFGARIADLPQTANALADMAIESEAAMLLAMRLVSATEGQSKSEHDARLLRIGVPLSKYWVCKRTNHLVLEALESHGGMGYTEEQPIARILREAPLNSIWEGTAAIMGLDFVRSVRRDAGCLETLLAEIRRGVSADRRFTQYVATLETELSQADLDLEASARRLMGKTALALQASLLSRHAPAEVADLFVASRLADGGPGEMGMLPAAGPLLARIAQRSLAADAA